MSASINGYLNLGTALSGSVVTPPPSGAGYAPQYVNFTGAVGGVTLNGISCTFGPLTAPWGTLTAFNVTDASGNPYFAGTLQAPFTPLVGQLVVVPQGNISLAVGSQFNASVASQESVPNLTYSGAPSGFVGSGSAVLVASGTYRRTFTIQTLPNSTSNVWMRPGWQRRRIRHRLPGAGWRRRLHVRHQRRAAADGEPDRDLRRAVRAGRAHLGRLGRCAGFSRRCSYGCCSLQLMQSRSRSRRR
jgi:hypothetical protein